MRILELEKPISPYQFAGFRILFGMYLTVHFIQLIPYAGELFSDEGVLANPNLNPLHGLFPNPLAVWDTPIFAVFFVAVSAFLSVMFTVGVRRRTAAVLLWFAWACLFNRNNLISNPGLPYVGLILILCALLPRGDRLSLGRARNAGGTAGAGDSRWYFPSWIYWTAWLLLATGYTFSGVVKLASPSWVNGDAMLMLLENPLARDGIFREIALALPNGFLRILTWFSLGFEIVFLLSTFSRITRFSAWLAMIAMHLGLVLLVDFADLTLGMLMIHFFVFDPDWLRVPETVKRQRNIVFFDGVCLMCNSTVKFLSSEDTREVLFYAPLQGDTYPQSLREKFSATTDGYDSIVFVEAMGTPSERVSTHSTAAGRILRAMGGFWRLVGVLIIVIPPRIRDIAYRFVANHRYQWFGKTDGVCELPTNRDRERMLP